jgi:uncharacterized delta-60 repeat protein
MILQSKVTVAGKLFLLIAAFIVFSSFSNNANAAGVFDLTFGSNGRVSTEIGNSAQSNGVISYPDGRILVVGNVTRDGTGQDTFLVRYLVNGLPDASFGSGGRLFRAFSNGFESANGIALQPDGKIIVAGSRYSPENESIDFFVARFLPEGLLDPSFGSNGVFTLNQGAVDAFNAVAIQPDGKIVAAGRTSDGGRAAVVRLNNNGTLDGSFGGGEGFAFLDLPNLINEYFGEIAFAGDGQILLGGTASPFIENQPNVLLYTNILVLLDSDGQPNPLFGNQGLAQGGSNHFGGRFDFDVLPDNRILTIGAAIVRFLPNGAIDTTFPIFTAQNVLSELSGTLAVRRSDGKFITTSNFFNNAEARIYNPNGRIVGRAANFTANNSVVQSDDKVVFTRIESGNTLIITRLITINSQGTRLADYDNDEKTDFAVLRPTDSTLYVLGSTFGSRIYQSGEASFEISRVIPESFNPSFPQQIVYWRAGNIVGSPASFVVTNGAGNRQTFQWGVNGDVPVGGDYDGDNRTDFTVYRPSEGVWYISQSSNNQILAVRWGLSEDKPVPADYDYDGITDIAVYRPSQGIWYVRRSSDGNLSATRWGISTDIPLTGDFDGDGHADFVVYRPSEGIWYLLQTRDGFRAAQFGISTDQPVPGEYDGDGRTDIAVFRSGNWYVLGSTRGFYAVQWGATNDIPVAVRYAY